MKSEGECANPIGRWSVPIVVWWLEVISCCLSRSVCADVQWFFVLLLLHGVFELRTRRCRERGSSFFRRQRPECLRSWGSLSRFRAAESGLIVREREGGCPLKRVLRVNLKLCSMMRVSLSLSLASWC